MALDRGTLAKIDRRVFAELGQVTATQAAKVPLSDVAWSTWRRYCQAIGLTMGEAVAGLIDHELHTVVDESSDADFKHKSIVDYRGDNSNLINRNKTREIIPARSVRVITL